MSGVIDAQGLQWEHCNSCAGFFRFPENLGYEKPTARWHYGRMLCVKCVDMGIRDGSILFSSITPASEWRVTEVS